MNNSVDAGGNKPIDNNISQHTKVSDDDKMFLDGVKTAGMLELIMAKQALQSTNPKIKSFAEMMIRDHTQMDKEAEALATQSKIVLKNAYDNQQAKDINMMKNLKGAQFDQHYKEMMVKSHAQTVELFKLGMDTREEKVKEFATKSLAVIQSHYEAAKQL
jgi:putative membrane protein